MDFVIKGKSSIFVKEEVTEGTYIAPTSAAEAIEVLDDFAGFEFTKEKIERKVLKATVESVAPRAGLPSASGALPSEFKSAATEGAAPRADLLYKSLLGGKRQVSTVIELIAGSTTTVLKLDDADINKIEKGDSLHIKIAGAHCVRPVASVSNVLGNVEVTLAIPAPSAPAAGVEIAPLTTYFFNEDPMSVSVTAEMGGEISEQFAGGQVESAEISNWTTGQIPQINFSMKGLSLNKADTVSGLVPDFSAEPQPPVALEACAYIDGIEVDYVEFSLTMGNTLVDVLSPCSAQGKIGSRNTNFLVSGKINPYMKTDAVDRFTKYNDGTPVSLFIHISNPGAGAGEIKNSSAIWLPQVSLTAIANGDQDGVLTDDLEFQAYVSSGNDTMFLSFI
jgi:hypothetical protein